VKQYCKTARLHTFFIGVRKLSSGVRPATALSSWRSNPGRRLPTSNRARDPDFLPYNTSSSSNPAGSGHGAPSAPCADPPGVLSFHTASRLASWPCQRRRLSLRSFFGNNHHYYVQEGSTPALTVSQHCRFVSLSGSTARWRNFAPADWLLSRIGEDLIGEGDSQSSRGGCAPRNRRTPSNIRSNLGHSANSFYESSISGLISIKTLLPRITRSLWPRLVRSLCGIQIIHI